MGSRTVFSPAKAGYNAANTNAELTSVTCPLEMFMAGCSLSRIARVLAIWFALPIFASATRPLPPIIANQNHAPAGVLRGGVLSLQLEIAKGEWPPEADDGIALSIYAFGEKAHPLLNPGPLIRVPQGTEIRASLHNTLNVPVVVHGLCDPGSEAATRVAPSEVKQVTFKATTPGLYFYWGVTQGEELKSRYGIDAELTGALVVDPAGASERDEVFVIEMLSEHAGLASRQTLATINGKSWPYTQHFRYELGQPVRWRWVNASNEPHALHLHGFYYRIDAINHRGQVETYQGESRPLVVTQRIPIGDTFDMSWSPERAGQWLFHCHMLVHMTPPTIPQLPGLSVRGKLAGLSEHAAMQGGAGMGQLVLGVTVPTVAETAAKVAWHADRKLKLVISEREGAPRYALQLREGPQAAADADKTGLIGPPIVLNRGQPVEIEVVNRLQQPTAIHWHGIELESYYDGVPGWSGAATQVTPPIAPGTSFVARMAPPRAGTFIYHTHWHDESQLTNGLYGPLIVLPPGEKFDPASDLVFVFSIGDFSSLRELALINGTPQSKTLPLEAGKKYRFRLINISTNNQAMQVSLRNPQGPVEWRVIAKDGADLPPAALHSSKAQLTVTVGETYDVEFSAAAPQDLLLDLLLPGQKIHTTQTLEFLPQGKTAPNVSAP
jgi:FtsP/CotA-like multicopper oxidase with cupredoxin domain